MHAIALGTKVRDTVSGWEGTATARYEYMNGCERYGVSGVDKDGAPTGLVFDVQQLEVQADATTDTWVPAEALAAARVVGLVDAGLATGTRWEPSTGGSRDNQPVQR